RRRAGAESPWAERRRSDDGPRRARAHGQRIATTGAGATAMISAWEARDMMLRAGIERAARNALQAAALLGKRDVDIGRMVLQIAELAGDARHRALMLGAVAPVLTEAGRPEEGLALVQAALAAATVAGRDTALEVLADGASTLAAVDRGQLLGTLC